MSSITPFLWFENQAEEAMHHYLSIFRNSKTISVSKAGGRVTAVTFELDGQRFIALNAGPHHKFNESISFFISCETQDEIDYYWNKLTAAGGAESQCGWLKIGSASRGRWCRQCSVRSCPTPIRKKPGQPSTP